MDFYTLSTGADTGYYHAQVEANPGEDAGYDGGKA
jgi:hypothetical protein